MISVLCCRLLVEIVSVHSHLDCFRIIAEVRIEAPEVVLPKASVPVIGSLVALVSGTCSLVGGRGVMVHPSPVYEDHSIIMTSRRVDIIVVVSTEGGVFGVHRWKGFIVRYYRQCPVVIL